MHSVRVFTNNAIEAIEFKNSLIRAGLVIEKDFVWRYYRQHYDWAGTMEEPGQAVFDFQDPAMATFYQLKWS